MKFKKNKVIISSLIGLTALTVCGVGFSAWIIGLNQPEVPLEGIGVQIDTITEETCYLNIVKSSSETGLVLANGTADKTGEGIGAEFDSTSTKDLIVNLEQFDLAFADTSEFGGLTFEVVLGDKESTAELKGDVGADDPFGRTEGSHTYIELKNYNNLTELQEDFKLATGVEAVDGYNIYKFKEEKPKALTFSWGSFFNEKEPATFYQDFISIKTATSEKLTLMNQARDELEAMDSFFKNGPDSYKTITIKATLKINKKTN